MKFKVIFILFNVVIIISFLMVFLLPFFAMGPDFPVDFWSNYWYFIVLFFGILAVLNFYFLYNWKLFQLLENEDWEGVINLLGDKIFEEGKISKQSVRTLIHASLLKVKFDVIQRLEAVLQAKKPQLCKEFAIELGIPYLLSSDHQGMVAYYEKMNSITGVKNPKWIEWNLAYGYLLNKRYDEAEKQLLELYKDVKDPVLALLTLYLLNGVSSLHPETNELVATGRQMIKDSYTPHAFEMVIQRNQRNIQSMVLAKPINEARNWVFEGEA